MTNSSEIYLKELHQLLNHYFDLSDIQDLCLQLNVDYESIAGEEKPSRIRSLLLGLAKNGRLSELIVETKRLRPRIEWPSPPDRFELPEALETVMLANKYYVYGDIVHGDKISGDKIMGDKHEHHHYPPESKLPLPPCTELVPPDDFVGRDWLIAEVDNFLTNNDQGVFVVEANAGLGKTAFLAYLVQKRKYVHHFINAYGFEDYAAVVDIATQLINTWQLEDKWSKDKLQTAFLQASFLQSVLFTAANKRNLTRPEEKIVIVLDALDEAIIPNNRSLQWFPQTLPKGVYLIVAQRPVHLPIHVDGAQYVCRLKAESERNLSDIRLYLEEVAKRPTILNILENNNYTRSQFINLVSEKSEGNWLYLHHIVLRFENSTQEKLDLMALPRGVWQIYIKEWQRWREQDRKTWRTINLPVLATLASAQNSLSLQQLYNFINARGRHEQQEIHDFLIEELSPFLVETTVEKESHYRFYHQSVRDFHEGLVDETSFTNTERILIKELVEATMHAHGNIADYFLSKWGGLHQGLPGLKTEAGTLELGDYYGFQYLTVHLKKASRWEDYEHLLNLTSCVDERAMNLWAEVQRLAFSSHSNYLIDIRNLWDSKKALSGRIRYALIHSTLVSIIQNIVNVDSWKTSFGEAILISDDRKRIETLAQMMPSLSLTEQIEAKAIAYDLASNLKNPGYLRAYTIEKFSPYFVADELSKVYELTCSLTLESQLPTMCALIANMPNSGLRKQVFEDVNEILKKAPLASIYFSVSNKAQSHRGLLHPNIKYDWGGMIPKSLKFIQLLPVNEQKALLTSLFSNFSRKCDFIEAEYELRENRGWVPFAVAIATTWSSQAPLDIGNFLQSAAVDSISKCEDDDSIANSILTLAPILHPDYPELFNKLKESVGRIESEWIRSEVLLHFKHYLNEQEIRSCKKTINNLFLFLSEQIRWYRYLYSNIFTSYDNDNYETDPYGCLTKIDGMLDKFAPIFQVISLLYISVILMIFWLISQFRGGLGWNIHESGEDYQDSPSIPKFTNLDYKANFDRLVNDELDRNITLYSLSSGRDSFFKNKTTGQRLDFSARIKSYSIWRLQKIYMKRAIVYKYTSTCSSQIPPIRVLKIVHLLFLIIYDSWIPDQYISSVNEHSIGRQLYNLHISGLTKNLFVREYNMPFRLSYLLPKNKVEQIRAILNDPTDQALEEIVSILPPDLSDDETIDSFLFADIGIFEVLANLLSELPESELIRILPSLLEILQDVEDWMAAQVLIALSHIKVILPKDILTKQFQIVLDFEDYYRSLILQAFLPHLLRLSTKDAEEIVDRIINISANKGRQHMLINLRILAPLIEKVSGKSALEDVQSAIIDVGRWWP